MANPSYADLITAPAATSGDPRVAIANFLDSVQTNYDALGEPLKTFQVETRQNQAGTTIAKTWIVRAIYDSEPGDIRDEP